MTDCEPYETREAVRKNSKLFEYSPIKLPEITLYWLLDDRDVSKILYGGRNNAIILRSDLHVTRRTIVGGLLHKLKLQ